MNTLPQTNKSLGQHWLQDEYSLDAMLEAADIQPDDIVLEIGPGPGTLTKKLVQKAARVIAVEFDEKLARELPSRVPASNLTVVQSDILSFDFDSLPAGYKIVANIPYYLTSNLLRLICEGKNSFSKAAILMQKEVAQRVCAKPGDMSLLSVSVQLYTEATTGLIVPAYLFTPPPKVDSQILKLTFREAPLFSGLDTNQFFRVVKAGFSQRRKTLLNSLSSNLHLSKEQVTRLLTEAKIDSAARAQTLGLADWYRLAKEYSKNT